MIVCKSSTEIAGGVPLMCDEPADFRTFRLGLFGLDKWRDVDGTVRALEQRSATATPPRTPTTAA